MSLQGATPYSSTARQVGAAYLPVRPTRTQSLQQGDTVLMAQKKCTVVSAPERNHEGRNWRVALTLPDGTSRVVCKPPGFTWAVLDNTQQDAV